MNKLLTTGLVFSTVMLGGVQAQAANLTGIVIDDFNTQTQNVTVSGPVAPSVAFPVKSDEDTSDFSASILGGYRNIFVEMTFDEFGRDAVAEVRQSVITGNGTFSISNDDGVDARTVATWDGNGDGLNFDLLDSDSYTNAFALDILSIDLNATLKLTVMDNDGETAMLSRSGLSSATTAIFDYEDFTVSSGSGTFMDIFNDVKSVSLEVTGPTAFDASFDSFDAVQTGVPEPTSVLSLIGIIGFGAARMKKMSVK